MEKISGIYRIINTRTKRMYIGCSSNIHKRFADHMRDLRKGEHSTYKLQFAYNLSKNKDEYCLEVLEDCTKNKYKLYQLMEIETGYINKFCSDILGYNMTNNKMQYQDKYKQEPYKKYRDIDFDLRWDLKYLKSCEQSLHFNRTVLDWRKKDLDENEKEKLVYQIETTDKAYNKTFNIISNYLSWIDTPTDENQIC